MLIPHPLFTPLRLTANLLLRHRVVFAPVSRLRASPHSYSESESGGRVPLNPLMTMYYEQRSRRPGTLLISEGTLILQKESAMSLDRAPGCWSAVQVGEWRKITDAVHANQSFIFQQLWAEGTPLQPTTGAPRPAGSPLPRDNPEHQLSTQQMRAIVHQYAQAARNSVHGAGFDGVEIHAGNGYLLDHFLQEVTNKRTDEYGGSIEKRSKFPLEVIQAVASAVGEDKVGVRVSPWSTYQGMGTTGDPIPQFAHFIQKLRENHPKLAYLHALEPEMDEESGRRRNPEQSDDFIRKLWLPRPLITCEGYTRESGMRRAAMSPGELVAFARDFVSNPDLPDRLEHDIPLSPYDTSTFYTGEEKGYIDYPFASKEL